MNEATANHTMQPARVLLGWMDTEEALRVQQGYRADVASPAVAGERLRVARERVAARPPWLDQGDAVTPLPNEVAPYLEELLRHPATEKQLSHGWTPSLVDLRRLCAFQPRVFTTHWSEQVRAADPNDLSSIAAISLPTPTTITTPACFDRERNAWVLTSPDPNLRVVGNFSQSVDDLAVGFGFSVALGSSLLSVMQHAGRHYLANGYHRAVAFLRRGITHVPAMTHTLDDGEPFALPSAMLPASAYLGARPPSLPDFLDEEVSASVELPLFRKVIVIQALEVMA
jgi:hypothetical protein